MKTLELLPIRATTWPTLLSRSADPRTQRAFDRFHDRVNHLAMRWGMYAAALLWALSGILGMALRPWNTDELLQCLGIVLPFYVAVGVALGEPRFRGHYQWLAALCNLSSGLLVFAVAPLLPEPALSALVGLVIITLHAVVGLRLRVRYALPAMLLYNGLYLFHLWSGQQVRTEAAIVSTFLIGLATIGAACAAFVLETNLWTLFRSRSVQRAKRMRPGHRASALPEELARRWREHPGLITERAETMNVLVARITFEDANGGNLNERLEVLHTLLARFDTLTHRSGLERVRMTGGEYVVAASAARIGNGGANDMAELALTMLHLAEETLLPNGATLTLRIGMDQERAVCAAMGKAIPAYDVIGPAVDGATVLCEGAPEGCILVSGRFQHVVSERFETQECGSGPGSGEPAFLLWGVRTDRKRGTAQVLRSVTRLAFLVACTAPAYPCAAQWERITALPPFDTPSLLVHEGVLYAGTDSTVWHSADGSSWVRGATLPTPGYFVDAIGHIADTLYAGTGGQGVFASADEGATWQEQSEGLAGLGSSYINWFAVRQGRRYCSTVGGGVFAHEAGAWTPFDQLANMNAGNVDMLRTIGDTLWAGAGGNGYLWRSVPGTDLFEAIQVAPLEWDAHMITDLIRIDGGLLVAGTYGIYRSTDGGDTWTWSSSGLPGGAIVKFIPTGSGLLALRSTGSSRLFRSSDAGLTWEPVEQMPFCYAIAEFQGRLYAARLDGLWVRDLSTDVGDELRSEEVLKLFPNPASDQVQVYIDLRSEAVIEVLDMQGRTIRQERMLRSTKVLDLHGSAPGTYLVRVVHSSGTQEERLIVR
jgi:class 3 adenylate cyclase/photosystem II stability/assembly factor-like uncharacterized protein